MGLQVVCDCGCGKTSSDLDGMKAHGFMHKVYYLPECSEKMDKYLEERNKIHTEVSTIFKTRMEKLKKAYLKVNPDAKLPDIP